MKLFFISSIVFLILMIISGILGSYIDALLWGILVEINIGVIYIIDEIRKK